MFLDQLPNEIWLLIFEHLDNTDINVLCSIDELGESLKRMICAVHEDASCRVRSDLLKHSFPNATHFMVQDVLGSMYKVSKFPFVVLVLRDSKTSSAHRKVVEFHKHVPRLRVVFTDSPGGFVDMSTVMKQIYYLQSRVCLDRVSFPGISKSFISLSCQTIESPERFTFGLVKTLTLDRCKPSDPDFRCFLPRLEDLTISGNVQNTMTMFDFEAGLQNLKRLCLNNKQDPKSRERTETILQGIKSPSLETLKIAGLHEESHRPFDALINIHLPNCSRVDLAGTQALSTIKDVYIGKVKTLCINDETYHTVDLRPISERCLNPRSKRYERPFVNVWIDRLCCPELQSLDIGTYDFFTFTSSDQTLPTSLSLRFKTTSPTDTLLKIDPCLFRRVKELSVQNGSQFVRYTPLIKRLTIAGDTELLEGPSSGSSSMLHTLAIQNDILHRDEPYLKKISHNITKLTIHDISGSPEDMAKAVAVFPSVQKLEFSAIDWGRITGLNYHTLSHLTLGLKYDSQSTQTFQILNCSFNNLKDFSIKFVPLDPQDNGTPPESVLKGKSIFVFSAPKLETLYISGPGMVVDELDLDGFPKLKVLRLHCHLAYLTFEECGEELETLEFCPQMPPADQDSLFNLKRIGMKVYSSVTLGKLTKMIGMDFMFSEALRDLDVPLLSKWKIPDVGSFSWSWTPHFRS